MQPRKRFEIAASDLLAGAAACLRHPVREELRRGLERRWVEAADTSARASSGGSVRDHDRSTDGNPAGGPVTGLACLSVRSALDLYLTARAFPSGSEILMTGANVPDMARVVAAHGLTPVPVDFHLAALAPSAEAIDAHRTDRSRALIFAHLFGAVVPLDDLPLDDQPLDDVASLCRRHGLDLVEDCAQAFRGPGYRGHPAATLSLFSFGPIKSATALAGALVTVRDPDLDRAMRRAEAAWPVVGDLAFLRRLGKYAGLALLTLPAIYGLVDLAARMRGRDLDAWVGGAARSFPGDHLLAQIRRRPGGALLALLDRRQHRCDADLYRRRAEAGRFLAAEVGDAVTVPGADLEHHTFWVFPVLADEPAALVEALRQAGFDATRHATLAPLGRDLPRLEEAFSRLVYLPFDVRVPRRRLRRMAAVMRHAATPAN